ncbi:MAG: ribonuclease P protein component [Puniceicoccales bacterium]|jgi:ribonuclease P protein component|nr:ribonuclease P protein component [Puniceicoccales bacterium]
MFRLFKSQRLRKSSDFEKFRSKGTESVYGQIFVLKSFERAIEGTSFHDLTPRIGIVTSRKIGNAVTRNRIRRVVREAFRLNLKYFKQSHDYLFIAFHGIGTKSNKEITNAILNAAKLLWGQDS